MDFSSSVVGDWSIAETQPLAALGYNASRLLSEAGFGLKDPKKLKALWNL